MTSDKNSTFRVGRALNIFVRRGGSGEYTKPFSEFEDSIQATLLQEANDGEVPILASYRNPESWVLLTSSRLVWLDNGGNGELPWERIRDATMPASALAAFGSSAKSKNDRLSVQTDSDTVDIVVEPGMPFIGFWNVLKSVPTLCIDPRSHGEK